MPPLWQYFQEKLEGMLKRLSFGQDLQSALLPPLPLPICGGVQNRKFFQENIGGKKEIRQ